MLEISYESEGFPAGGPVANGVGILQTSWDDLLWAAVTVGRPNRHYVFRHGLASRYEALFRWSLVRMALEQSGPSAYRLRRTAAAKTLDPSEKGAVNYFLGLAICKLFADSLLNVPWMIHLDVFRPTLDPLLKGRSRPDLIGQNLSGEWVVLECKGRASEPNGLAKDKAKEQAQRVISVSGAVPSLSVGGITYFRNDVLEFFWRDPPVEPERVERPIEVVVEPRDWRHYYMPLLEVIRSEPTVFDRMLREPAPMRIEALDLEISIHPRLFRALSEERWTEARGFGDESVNDVAQGEYHRDGIRVKAGPTWLRPFEDEGAERT